MSFFPDCICKTSPDFSQHEGDVNEDDEEAGRQKGQIVGDRRPGDVAKRPLRIWIALKN